MRRRVKEAFATNPPRRFRLPSFIRGRRKVNPFRSRGRFTGLDQFNAERETDLAMRRYRESSRSGLVTRVRRKGGTRKRKKVSRSVGSMKRKMARVRSFIKRKGGTKVMARHKRGRPRKRHRITRHFGRRIGVSNVSVLLNRPKRRRRSVVSRHRRYGNPLSVIGLNPRRKHRRSRRHNPVSSVLSSGGGIMSIAKTILPLGITAGIGGVVTKLAPGFLGANVLTNQWLRYGAQVGVGVVGCMLVTKVVNKQYGVAFGIGAVAVIAMDLIQGWLLTMTVQPVASTAGVGTVNYNPNQYQYPGYPGRVGVFTRGRITGNAGVGNMGAFSDPYHE